MRWNCFPILIAALLAGTVLLPVRPASIAESLALALSCKAQSAIEELVQQPQQFHLAVDFDRAAHEALAL
jgi:hypothetical protein